MSSQRSNPGYATARHPLHTLQARLRLLQQEDSGNSIIEVAISYMLLFTIMLAVIQFCMMVYTYSVYSEAARQGVRYAISHGSNSSTCSGPTTGCGDTAGNNVISTVNAYAKGYIAAVAGMSVKVSYPDSSCAPPSRAIVTVTYTYAPMFNVPGFKQAFTIISQGRILY